MCPHNEWIYLSKVCRKCKDCGEVELKDPCDKTWKLLK